MAESRILRGLRTTRALWTLWGIAALAICVFAATRGGPVYSDEQSYLEIARNVVDGVGYVENGAPTASRPPVWPLLIAAFLVVEVPVANLAVVSSACLIGAAALARGIAGRIAGTAAGWIAAFAMLLYPLNVYTAATLYPQALAALLTLGMVSAATRIPGTRWSYAAIGGAGALLVLAVPTMVFTAGVIGLWALWQHRSHWRRYVVLAGLAFVVPVMAWTVRNYVVFDEPIPISTTTGVNLLLGNNANATASSGVGADISGYYVVGERLNEPDRSAYFTDQAVKWVQEDPPTAAKLYAAKVANYFVPYNEPQTAGTGSAWAALIAWVTFIPLLLLAVLRIVIIRRIPWMPTETLLWSLFVGNALFMAIAFTRTRFRMPLDSFLIIEAAVFLMALVFIARLGSCPDGRTRWQALERFPGSSGNGSVGEQSGHA